MTPETYRLIHIAGLMLVFLGLGGVLLRPSDGNTRTPLILHGLGMLALLIAGFGMLSKLGLDFRGWVAAKLGLWLLLGALPVLVKRRVVAPFLGWMLAVGTGVAAVWLALHQPF